LQTASIDWHVTSNTLKLTQVCYMNSVFEFLPRRQVVEFNTQIYMADKQ